MPSIVRLKQTEATTQMFELLQNTIYAGLGKTEILRTILAEKTWEIKNQIKKAYQSHKAGKSISVKNKDIEEFLETLN